MARRGRRVEEDVSPADIAEQAGVGRDERLDAMASVAKDFEGWRPAREVLTKVEAVPTIFPQFDRATRVYGFPLARVTTVHGPSNHGKTVFALGCGLSFLRRHHFLGLVDAENTTPISWLENLMAEYANHPGFVALRPTSYEETVDLVRRFLERIGEAREKGRIPKLTSGLVVVDSIRKLVPKNILAKIMKEGAEGKKGSVDGMGGRAAQIKAALNAAWMDELTQMLAQTNTSALLIARESEDTNADANDQKYGRDFKIGGGRAIVYDASLVGRVMRASWVREGSGEDSRVIGERHVVRLWKTKVGGKEDRHTDCYFHTSNGVLIPEGFDRARDVAELALHYGVLKHDGKSAWLTYGKQRWNGINQAVKALSANETWLDAVEQDVRANFRPDETLPGEEES